MINKSAMISAEELKDIMDAPHVKILDASYNQPALPVRIPGAQIFDIDKIADKNSHMLHMLPTAEDFAETVGKMGIKQSHTVILYDRAGIYMAAARAWWMFRVFGHKNVYVLNGGLGSWVEKDFDLEPTDIKHDIIPQTYVATFDAALVKNQDDILKNIDTQNFTLIDARDGLRFSGASEDPRAGVASGHVPDAVNLPFDMFIQHDTGVLKSPEQIKTIMEAIKVDTSKPIAVTCGSGITACVLALGLHEMGLKNVAIYDGSWTEWGSNADLPKAKGKK